MSVWGFWCAKLSYNILINYERNQTPHDSFRGSFSGCRLSWHLFFGWNLIATFLVRVSEKFSAVFVRSNSIDGLTWHVTNRLLEFRILFFVRVSIELRCWFFPSSKSVVKYADVSPFFVVTFQPERERADGEKRFQHGLREKNIIDSWLAIEWVLFGKKLAFYLCVHLPRFIWIIAGNAF